MLIICLYFIYAEKYTILLNSSTGFRNYRHMTDIHIINHILLNYRYKPSNIIGYYAEDIIKDKRNPSTNKIYLDNNTYILHKNIHKEGYTINDFLNGILCNSDRLKYVTRKDNILIYMCGHGNEGVFKFYDKEWLTREDLFWCIRKLSEKVNKVLLIIDTCQAESMVDRNLDNVYVVTTSPPGMSSYSFYSNDKVGVSCVDNFTFEFYKFIEENSEEIQGMSLNEIFRRINNKDIGSKLTYTDNEEFIFGDFFIY